ncbi:SRPBCC family protein [Amycolatopsis methanolica]|uniref:Activator of Hsp90 ATPase 1 family protein n=1 Tax=Amycolatopsis methanolica 239 TaxID=1068978 RepID=A0A076MQQ4_AMYME|nr:SRPBCC family protein [Amycolatopsis methanolica]AIJ23014.1 activator of Hsp90 ATPase 1 family protein [Amycolatopsis methanolica 239]
MLDIANHLKAIHREVRRGTTTEGETVTVLVRRRYDATAEDVWDAVTDPARVRRWFLPLTGDLREGGSFQLEGNAGGDILTCDPPRLLKVTFGGPTSVVQVRLAGDGDSTELELEHTVPIEIAQSGAGALFVGPGWDSALMALAQYFAGDIAEDPVAAANSREVQEFCAGSVTEWSTVVEDSGTATAEEIAGAAQISMAQFAPDLTGDTE